jgi:hypothetical protein
MAKHGEGAWSDVSSKFATDLLHAMQGPLQTIERRGDEASKALTEASQALWTVADKATTLMDRALDRVATGAFQRIEGPLRELNEATKRDYPEAVARIQHILEGSAQTAAAAQSAVERLYESTQRMAPTLQAWESLNSQIQHAGERLKALGLSKEELDQLRILIQHTAEDGTNQKLATTVSELSVPHRRSLFPLSQSSNGLRGCVVCFFLGARDETSSATLASGSRSVFCALGRCVCVSCIDLSDALKCSGPIAKSRKTRSAC